MLTGWFIAIAAVLLLHTAGARAAFAATALAIEALGLGLIARTYLLPRGERFD